MADPAALGRVLGLLPSLSPRAREGAGLWLFAPEAADELALRRRLLAELEALTGLAARLPEPWLLEGLADLYYARGGTPLRRLLGLARRHAWARQVVGLLPPDARLPGGHGPQTWLARHALGRTLLRRALGLARQERWASLAEQGPLALGVIQAALGANPAPPRPRSWPGPPGPRP